MKKHLENFLKSLIQRKILYVIYLTVRYWVVMFHLTLDTNLLYFTMLTDIGVYILLGLISFEKVKIEIKK